MAWTEHVVQSVLCFLEAYRGVVTWCHLEDGRLVEAPRIIFPLPSEVRRHIDSIGFLSLIFRSRLDLTLGLLAYLRAAEVHWVLIWSELLLIPLAFVASGLVRSPIVTARSRLRLTGYLCSKSHKLKCAFPNTQVAVGLPDFSIWKCLNQVVFQRNYAYVVMW